MVWITDFSSNYAELLGRLESRHAVRNDTPYGLW